MIDEMIVQAVENALNKAIPANLEKMTSLVLSKYDEKIVGIETASEILGKHPDTVRNYVKYGLIEPEPRATERSPYKFRLSTILKITKEDLR